MECEKRLKLKIVLNIVLFIIGVCAVIVSIYINANTSKDTFTASYLSGTGTGLIIVAAIMAVKKTMILKNKQKLKEYRIESEDERNLILAYRASHYSLVLTAAGAYSASLFFAFFNEAIVHILAVIICILILTRFILYYILRKSV